MNRRAAIRFGVLALAFLALPSNAALASSPAAGDGRAEGAEDDSPETKMARRFPQKMRVGHLIGLPLLDENDVTLGLVQKVVRTPEGKIKLIVSYSNWFGWFGRLVAVPVEVVAILARQIISIDMPREDYPSEPTWSQSNETVLPDDEIIRIALARR